MSSEESTSAYPDSVQSGIPRLAQTPPAGWARAPLSQFLREEPRPVELDDDVEYDLVTVRRARGGVVKRESKFGRDISVKAQFGIKTDDFLISKRQIVHGACGLVPESLDGSTVSNEYSVLKTSGALSLKFLGYLSHTVYFQQTCFHSSIGVHIEKMLFNLPRWLEWEFDIPPLAEQERIVSLLSTWDMSLETTERLINNAVAQKKALMRIFMVPSADDKWTDVTFGEMGSFFSGVTYAPSDVTDASGLLVLRSSNVQNGSVSFGDNVFVRADAKVSTLTQPGDVLICVRNGSRALIGKTAAISKESSNMAHGAFMSLFRPNASPSFCRQLFMTERFKKLVSQNLGATINSINTSDMKSFSFSLPPKSRWPQIGEVLEAQDRSIELLRAQHLNLTEQKKGLMQQLLTGIRRVRYDGEIAA